MQAGLRCGIGQRHGNEQPAARVGSGDVKVPEQTTSHGSRTPLWIAAAASATWLAVLAWLVGTGTPAPDDIAAVVSLIGQWAAPALAPVAALFALASAVMAGSRPAGAWPPVAAEDRLDGTEADLAGTISRVTTLRQLLADDVAALQMAARDCDAEARAVAEHAARIRAEAEHAGAAGAALAGQLPPLEARVRALTAGLETAATAIEARAGQLQGLASGMGEGFAAADGQARAATETVEGALQGLEARMTDARMAVSALVADLQNHAARSFDSSAQAMATIEKSVAAQQAIVAGSLTEARTVLETIGAETHGRLSGQLEQLARDAALLEERLQAQIAFTAQVGTSAERSFQLLDSRLELSMRATTDALDRLGQKIAGVNAETDRVAQPLRDGKLAAVELDAAVATLRETVMQTIDAMGQTLPEHAEAASSAAATLTGEVRALVAAIETAHGRATDLATPIAESRAVVEAATGAFVAQRAAMETAGQALVVELEHARQLIAHVEEQTRDTSLAAATRLVDAMTRVREVASQAAGTMRETLDGVIGEARGSLEAAADGAMQRSFVAPIAEQARQAEAAAEAASQTARAVSERAAASLLALATTMKQVEERAGRTQESLEALVVRDLNASAQLLTDRMGSSAIALASALGKPISDAELEAWRRGERSLFGRRLVAMLDKTEKRALADQLAGDPTLADLARRHVAEFEALLSRVGGDGPLARALGQSDSGRIAMILAEAMGG